MMNGEATYYPKWAVWELTNRCNAHCLHCGSESGQCRDQELTEAEALQLCEDLKELGCERVGIIGGEFFLSPYWESLVRKLLELGIKASLLTNGLLLNNQNITKLQAMGINNISVSIDGLAGTHDFLRGLSGIFDIAIEGIKKAKAAGFSVGIVTAISRKNVAEIEGMYQLFSELGVNVWQLQAIEDLGRVNHNPELDLQVEDLYLTAKKVAELRQNSPMAIVLGDNIGHFTQFEPLVREHPFLGCVAGRRNIGIESNGNIRGCLSIRGDENVVGNIRQRPLKEIWNDPEVFKVFRCKPLEKMEGFCAECEFARLCRAGCSSFAYSLTGSFYENPMCLHKYEVEHGLIESTESTSSVQASD